MNAVNCISGLKANEFAAEVDTKLAGGALERHCASAATPAQPMQESSAFVYASVLGAYFSGR